MSYGSFASNYRSPLSDLGNMVGSAEKNSAGMFNSFRNNRIVSGTTEFLHSNSLVAKVAFLILIVLIFVSNRVRETLYNQNQKMCEENRPTGIAKLKKIKASPESQN